MSKMSKAELVRRVRNAITLEFEAIADYERVAEDSPDENASRILRDIASEEVMHVGELLRLLGQLSPADAKGIKEGAAEVDESR